MSRYRHSLPQLSGMPFLTDGGLETTMIYHEGIELPEFAAFVMLDDPGQARILEQYYRRYAEIAYERGTGFLLEGTTYRASAFWGAKIGYDAAALDRINRASMKMLASIRDDYESRPGCGRMVISGCIGPKGDAYSGASTATADQAEAYHRVQIDTFVGTEADMISLHTMPTIQEALGGVRAARAARMPVAVSFTVETDGNLPSGETLEDAISEIDRATDNYPAYYMINCAHPSHFEGMLAGQSWTRRIMAVQANPSCRSHDELAALDGIDAGDPDEFGAAHLEIHQKLENLSVFGGCCGTDERHLVSLFDTLLAQPEPNG